MSIFDIKSSMMACAVAFASVGQGASAQSLGAELENFWERTGGGVNYSRPTAYEGQRGGYATLGSLYVRTQPRNTGLMNIQLPSVRAGCGGIDIFGGAFSFISKEEMILLLEGIMQNAAGFAFELALESLSPAVSEKVSQLRALIERVNSMNINSCEAGQLLVSSIWPADSAASDHICKTVGTMNGKFADGVATRHGCTAEGKQRETLGEATGALADQVPININYAWRAVMENPFLQSNHDIGELFMSMTGTVVTTASANDNEGPIHANHPPKAFSPSMIEALVEGGTINILKCDVDPEDKCLNPNWTDVVLDPDDTFFARVRELVQGMSDAIRDDDELTPEMVAIIGKTSVPVYDTLKTARAFKYQFVDDEIALISELVAFDYAIIYIKEALEEMAKAAANIDVFGNVIGDYQKSIQSTQNSLGIVRREAAEKYSDALTTLEKLVMAKEMLSATSGGRFAAMMGGK